MVFMSQQKQKLIIGFALQNENKISLDEAISIKGVDTYYCNERFHVGNILSRMVKTGILKRLKPGKFELIRTNKVTATMDQPKLF
jgi:predicted transcriptional regulator of viral defense system